MTRALVLLASIAILLAGCAARGPNDGPIDPRTGGEAATFSAPVRVGPNVGEPGLRIAEDGTVWVHWPGGLHVSRDGGKTFQEVSLAPGVVIGGDADLALAGTPGTLYYTDLEALAFLSVFRSTDDGATWLENPIASNVPVVDRQWIEVGPDPSRGGAESVYLAFNQLQTGIKVVKSTTGGLVFESAALVQTQQTCFRGNMAVSRADGTIVIADCDAEGVRAYVSTDGAATFTEHRVAERPSFDNVLFPIVAADAAGTFYFTWSERADGGADVWLATSPDGETWTEPVKVNPDGTTAVMPWVTAGSAGRIGLAYYESATRANPDDMPDDAEWRVAYAVATDAADGAPTLARALVSDDVIQRGAICLQGTACEEQLGGPGGRNLLDFFQVMPGPDGRAHLVWADGCDGCDAPETSRDAFVTYAVQVAGPRLVA